MITISNVDELEKILRRQLILQSEVNGNFVRNSLSLHGENLDKLLNNLIYESIDVDNIMILFELRSRENDSDMSETNIDDSISYYKSFTLYVIIYGDNSTNLANKIVARFRTQQNKYTLQSQGVYLEKISNPTKINEYKNETMWIRNDFEIDISCHLKIEQVLQDDDFDSLSNISMEVIK